MKKNLVYIFLIVIILAGVGIWYANTRGDKNHPLPPPLPVEKSIKVISPNGGERWLGGQKVPISWKAAQETKTVNIRLSISGIEDAQNFNATVASAIPNTGSYEWTVQDLYAETWGIKALPPSDKYTMTIEDSEHNNIYDTSDGFFGIK